MPRCFLALALLSSLLGCGAQPAPSTWLVYDQVSPGTYALVPAPLPTLRNAAALIGDVAHFHGGGTIEVDSGEPTTTAEYETAMRIVDDSDVALDYFVDNDVGVATDFDGLMMLTAYHHLEAAQGFFAAHGVPLSTMRAIEVYYRIDFNSGFLPIPVFTDNAAYAFTLDAFLLPQRFVLAGGVPLFANRGVVTHEYGHAVFNRLVHHDRRVPRYLVETWPSSGVNELRSLDEGLADVFGALATGDADFIAPSFAGATVSVDRDLDVERHYTLALLSRVQGDAVDDYDPYPLGSVVAGALWSQRLLVGDLVLADVAVEALRALDGDVARASVVAPFINGVVAAWPFASRTEACEGLRNRLDAIAAEIPCL